MCYIFLKYTQPEIAFSRSIFDFIIVSDVNTDAGMLWSLLNGFIFLNEPLHRHARFWSQDVGIITTRPTVICCHIYTCVKDGFN